MKTKTRNWFLLFFGIAIFIGISSAITIITEDTMDTGNITGINITANNFFGNWNGSLNYLLISNWNATNTSYALDSVLMNGSFFNVAGGDTFVANYSTFLTHITWANAMNGTLAKSSELNNGTYVISSILNNGSYLNYAWNSTNTSYALDSILMNGSFFNTAGDYDDTWINSTIDTKISNNNASVTNTFNLYVLISTLVNRVGNWSLDKPNYYTNTQVDAINTSMKNYVDVQNASQNNWISNVFNVTRNNYVASVNNTLATWTTAQNTSQTNYINFQNTSVTNALATKLNLAGGTMTGNISLGTSGVRLTNGTANTAVIYHNSSGWIIRG